MMMLMGYNIGKEITMLVNNRKLSHEIDIPKGIQGLLKRMAIATGKPKDYYEKLIEDLTKEMQTWN